ncbi:MAG: NTP transferase domain-containing protein, partial [Peptococcaceae bacterium]|nr:NTP transferase domain-containing protein [Peptococcaceae bacterium]
MKAILLAGGRGTRISRYVGEKPKCTLDIGGMSLIRHTVEMLLRNHVDVSIAVGYNKEMVVNSLEGLNVRYFYNPFYDVTNSIASLWFAKRELCGDDIIIANADVFWEQEILDVLIASNSEQVLLMDSSKDMDYLFKVDGTRLISH